MAIEDNIEVTNMYLSLILNLFWKYSVIFSQNKTIKKIITAGKIYFIII